MITAESRTKQLPENKRRARQLRPPPIGGQSTWQYDPANAAFEYANAPTATYENDGGLSFNYNPFLTLPSGGGGAVGGSSQQFKTDSAFYQTGTLKGAQSPFQSGSSSGNIGNAGTGGTRADQSNAVREYHLYKTNAASLDSSKDLTYTRGNSGTLSPAESYVPLYLSSTNSQQQQQKAKKLSAVGGDPENFSYFHIGSGSGGVATGSDSQTNHRIVNSQKKEPSIYIIHKPKPVLGTVNGGTPKTQVIQVSTVGGFFNNNPTADPFNNYNKKVKSRFPDDANQYFGTHKPVFPKTAAPVYETTYDKDFYLYNDQTSSEFLPISGTTSKVPTQKFINKNIASKPVFQQNPSQQIIYNYRAHDAAIPTKTGFFITRPDSPRPPPTVAPTTLQSSSLSPTSSSPLPWASLSWNSAANKSNSIGPNKPISSIAYNKYLNQLPLPESSFTQTRLAKVNYSPTAFNGNSAVPTFSSVLGGKGMSWTGQKNTVNVSDVKIHSQKVQTTAPTTAKTTTTVNPDDYYYDEEVDELAGTQPNEVQTMGRFKPVAPLRNTKLTTVKAFTAASTTLNSNRIVNNIRTAAPTKSYSTTKPKTTTVDDDYYYYDDDDVWTSQPPQNKSQYMPMSETAAPRPRMPTTLPTLSSSKYNFKHPQHQPHHHLETSSIPPIIKFPDDVFHGLRPMNIPRYLNQSTMRPYTVRTRLRPATAFNESTTQSSRVTSASTTHKIYTTTSDRTLINRPKIGSKLPKKLNGPWEFDERQANR